MTIFNNVHFTFPEGVPQLDGLVTRTRDDLTIVRGERNREDIVGVTDKTTSGFARVQIPETEGLVP